MRTRSLGVLSIAVVIVGAFAALLASAASAAPGDQLWVQSWQGPFGYEVRDDPIMQRGPGGDLWIAFTGMDGSTRDRDYALLRYAPTGLLRWEVLAGSPDGRFGYVGDLAVTGDRCAVITGSAGGAIGTVKIGPDGKRRWARTIAGAVISDSEYAASVAVDPRGNVYVLATVRRAATGGDAVLVKYSPSGARRWTRYISSKGTADDIGAAIEVGPNSDLFVAATLQTTARGKDVLVARYTPSGSLVWKRSWDGGGLADDMAVELAVNRSRVVVAGGSDSPTTASSGLVLTAKAAMRASDKLRARLTPLPGYDLFWTAVSVSGAGDIAAGGTAFAGTSATELVCAAWPAGSTSATVTHYTPMDGWVRCEDIWVGSGGAVVAAGSLATGGRSGMHLASLAPAPHAWSVGLSDYSYASSLVVTPDGIFVTGGYSEVVRLWVYER